MRHLFLTLGLFLPCLMFAQKDTEFKEISYTQFLQMIEDEEDSVFRLSNTFIVPDKSTDIDFRVSLLPQDSAANNGILIPFNDKPITIDKELDLRNVTFINGFANNVDAFDIIFYGLHHFTFLKPVRILDCPEFIVVDSHFKEGLEIIQSILFADYYKTYLTKETNEFGIAIARSTIDKNFHIANLFKKEEANVSYTIHRNTINQLPNNEFYTLQFNGIRSFDVRGNIWRGAEVSIKVNADDQIDFNKNRFETDLTSLDFNISEKSNFNFTSNMISGNTILTVNEFRPNTLNMEFEQFHGPIYSYNGYSAFFESRMLGFSDEGPDLNAQSGSGLDDLHLYRENIISYPVSYRNQMSLLGSIYQFYKSKHDTEGANLVYIRLKDLETERLEYLYSQSPGFTNFFKWKINQFLKLFSAYGTEPARAITMSVYVVLAFALVYLFFPNYWDSHGKNRIMDRYRFFLKYVNKDSGMHEVYLDEKKPELLASEDFRTYLQEQGKTAPKFFMATALPLYRWSVAGTKTFSWMLSKVDVLKGKWSDTEDSKRGIKSVLLIAAFLIALAYDIFIKILNALMLSINTFTTLGFGEIPIKGLPRYLAIIQGFIGWFMLTIFSVSLISQLLN